MDVSELNTAVRRYYGLGLATSTHKSYWVAISCFSAFCGKYSFPPHQPLTRMSTSPEGSSGR